MFDIVGKRYLYFVISLLVIVPGLVFMGIHWGMTWNQANSGPLPLAIDFTGGTLLEVAFVQPQTLQPAEVKAYLVQTAGLSPDTVVQTVGNNGLLIRTEALATDEQVQEVKTKVFAALSEKYGELDPKQQRTDSVGPSVGREVTQSAGIAVLAASIGILLYIALAFRHMPHPVRYGVCAIVAMLHDVLVVLGTAAIFGVIFGWQVDSLFLTALLTVIGFSVHDTIVVFDRIRENLARFRGEPYEAVVNHSIVQTLDRSINTQLTVMFTLLALVLFGGDSIRHFVLTLLIGVFSGTYSSIFNASPLLVVWENGEFRDFLGNLVRLGRPSRAAA
jgi:preprotein translocase subunit SecF